MSRRSTYNTTVAWKSEHWGHIVMGNGPEMDFSAPPDAQGHPGVLTPEVQEPIQAVCSCGSGIPVQDIVINEQTVTLVALPLIFQQFHEAEKAASPETTRELLETLKIYNPIPLGEDETYVAMLSREYAVFCELQGAVK